MISTDAQAHIWEADSPERPWLPEGKTFAHSLDAYRVDQLLAEMDVAGVDRAVLVPPSFEGDRNDVCLAAAQAHPERFAVMGRIPLTEPSSRDLLPRWRDQAGMLGVRVTFSRGAMTRWLHDGTADWLWAAAEEAGVPVMVFAPGQLDKVAEIAERHAGLRLTMDHLGIRTDLRDEQIDPVLDDLVTLSRFDNVAVKATCLPGNVTQGYPFPTLHPRIERVVAAFGPRRVFWGSDLTRLPCTYGEVVRLFTEELDFLSGEDLEWIMGRGISEWLGWPVAAAPSTG
jgi:predicted TIM-barrel fold metal-dependent hydrolase